RRISTVVRVLHDATGRPVSRVCAAASTIRTKSRVVALLDWVWHNGGGGGGGHNLHAAFALVVWLHASELPQLPLLDGLEVGRGAVRPLAEHHEAAFLPSRAAPPLHHGHGVV
ncbi:unnamed protein product, partial [Ectocarpus sp. 8 AP-2014]